ncbi:putative amino-acid transporter arg-13 [Erysiphe necator]|uniref:Putative amino-acid transporter arg-13 n=1 Tax=Uncinula necator TaxID=52586 RepID=A0A0B1P0U3_UNCNE|nr:putative amino-acid transporter arg-13 [Erysiphe necator]
MDALEDIVFGSVAGAVSKYFEYPFDTIKVRLQSQPDRLPPLYSGPLDCLRKSIKSTSGSTITKLLSLYRGVSTPVVSAVFENSSLFFWERIAQQGFRNTGLFNHDEKLPLPALWLTGATAGAATSFILTPFELVKCRIQAPICRRTDYSPFAIIGDIWSHGGIMGFWRGQASTLIRESLGSAAWFGSKESVSTLFRIINSNHNELIPLPLYQQVIAGASAGMSYNLISFPADTIKSRMQTSGLGVDKKSIWSETKAVWRHHGLKGYYRGCGITVMRSAPSSALIFCIFDGMKVHMPLSRFV